MRAASFLSVVAALALASACVPDPEPPAPEPVTWFQVTSTDDTLDGTCDTHCTLRDAIAAANADAVIDEIHLPAGTFQVAETTPTGADGEAYRVTDDLVVSGQGAGVTIVDGGGRDIRAVWRTTASLAVHGLAVRDLGAGTTTVARTVVAAPMAAPGETVRLDGVFVEDVQPDMSDAGGNGAAAIVTAGGASSATAHPFAIDVVSSWIDGVGRGIPFVNLGGRLYVTESIYERAPAILVGDEGPATNVFLPHDVVISGSRFADTTANVFSSCARGVSVLYFAGAQVNVTNSELNGGTGGPCGGVSTGGSGASSAGAVAGMSGFTTQPPPPIGYANIRKSTLVGTGDSAAVGILALGDGAIPEVHVDDSTLVAGTAAAVRVTVLVLGPGQAPTGGRVDLTHVTLVGPPAGPGLPTGIVVPASVPLNIANSVGLSGGAFLCGPGAALTSAGGNTFSDLSCPLTGPGDQTGVDPQLGPLADHGGRGRTLVPLPGSPLIDTAVGSTSNADERGIPRPQGAGNDRGAVERSGGD